MEERHLTLTGVLILAVTWIVGLVQRERSFRLLTDREKLGWVELFATHRLAGGMIPVLLVLVGLVASTLEPLWFGWSTVITVCGLLLFVLFWQYRLVRQLGALGFNRDFIRRTTVQACINQAGLLAGLALIAYAAAAKRV